MKKVPEMEAKGPGWQLWGTPGASPTLSVATGTSATTNTGKQKAPDQVMKLQKDQFELQPWGLVTRVIQINLTLTENLLGNSYLLSLPLPILMHPLFPQKHMAISESAFSK